MSRFDQKIFSWILSGALVVAGVSVGVLGNTAFKANAAGTDSAVTQDAVLGFQPIPADAMVVTGEDGVSEEAPLLLPSSGASYALSARKVSFQDVEDNLVAQNLLVREETPASVSALAAVTGSVVGASAGDEIAAVEDGEAQTEALEDAQDQDDSVATESVHLATVLTPVQEMEQTLVKDAISQVGELDEAAATQIAAGAVTVVVGGHEQGVNTAGNEKKAQDALLARQSEDTASAAASADKNDTKGNDAAASDSDKNDSDKKSESKTAEEAAAADAQSKDLAVSMVSDFLNIRAAASADSEVVGKLYSNSVAEILSEADEDGWVKIESGDVVGYVKQSYLATGNMAQEWATSLSKTKAVVTTETLRVRATNSIDSDVISLIGQGQALDIIEELDGWYKVNTEDGEGYISSDFADIEVIYPEAISRQQEEAEAAAKKAAEEKKVQQAAVTKGQQVVNYAMQFLGNPYVWGGSSLTNGADCSGFTMAVYAHFGVSLPHYDASQRSVGTAVSSLSEARPGDLICYYGHVGIYIGGGQIIHASNPREGIKIGSASYRQIAAIRRIYN